MKNILRLLLILILILGPCFKGNAALFGTELKILSSEIDSTQNLYYPEQIKQIYTARDNNAFWKDLNGTLDAAFIDSLVLIAEGNGLAISQERVARIKDLVSGPRANGTAETEILFLDWLIKLAHDLNGDSLPLDQLYMGWNFSREDANLEAKLVISILRNETIGFLVSLTPHDTNYLHLIQTLKLYRAIEALGGWASIPAGPTIKIGMQDIRLKQVRTRLEAEAYTLPLCRSEQEETVYDEKLKCVVIEYQMRNGLEADGNLGAKTIATLNNTVEQRIDNIRASMARLRAMPREWPARAAIINIADATALFLDHDRPPYLAPVIVGRTDRKTPFIKSAINSVILNPSWTVPDSIARQDILPKLKKDPHYLQKMGMVIRQNEDDPYGTQIDWNQIQKSEFVFRLRQAPGELNALGPIKFDFDNDYAVYLHGTSHKELFAKADRFLSSGCIRLQQPELVAEMVLSANKGEWSREKVINKITEKDRSWIKVSDPMPIFFIYQTVFFPSGAQTPHFRRDVYNYDKLLISAMHKKSI